jgi:uncharacterized protein (TIGR02444 family)
MTVDAPAPEAAKRQTSPFWRFSLRLYRFVAPTCLDLQDRFGVDVNVLLFLLFAAHNGRRVSADDVRGITAAVESWNQSVVAPLRAVRRFLRTPPEIIALEGGATLREHVKQVELEAERLQQEGLYRFVPLDQLGTLETSREAAARSNIERYAAELGTAFDQPLIEALLKGFAELDRSGEDRPGAEP